MRKLLFAGSFDPVTRGHMDIIRRSALLCDELVVAVMHNPDKQGAIPVERRVELLRKACQAIDNVRIVAHGGLLVDCAHQYGVDAVVRGVRSNGDYDVEFQMAQVNRLLGGIETLLLTAESEYAFISSSIVRQLAAFDGDISALVPSGMAEDIRKAIRDHSNQ